MLIPRLDDRPRGDALAASFSSGYAGVLAFLAVASEGNFARAGSRLGIGRSAVSRSVQKLEDQLGARLFLRTTRQTTLTHEGELFFENCHPGVERIVRAMDDMRELRLGPPRGRLRVASTVGFGRKVVAPLIGGFRGAYPHIAVDLLLDEEAADFAADRMDVAFRDGHLEDSEVIARQLMPMAMMVCAAPAYVRRHGLPTCLEDLSRHRCINYRTGSGCVREWEFRVNGALRKITPGAMDTFNDPELVLRAVVDGLGIAQIAAYQAAERVATGELVSFLDHHAPLEGGHYICYPSRQHLPVRTRVFVDYMLSNVRPTWSKS